MTRIDDIMNDLQDPIYWDLGIKGSFRVLQLRQEWDKKTAIEIRDRIIKELVTVQEK